MNSNSFPKSKLFPSTPPVPKIVCIGDSLTSSYYNNTDRNKYCPDNSLWTNLVALQTGYNVINKGIASQRSSQLLARFTTDVLDLNPTHCIIEEGANDPFKKVPTSTTMNNINTMVQLCKSRGIIPLIMNSIPETDSYWSCTVAWGMTDPTIIPPSDLEVGFPPTTTYNFDWENDPLYNLQNMRNAEANYCYVNNIPYIDIYNPFLLRQGIQDNSFYIYDHVHPNEKGHMKITEIVINVLKTIIP